MHLQESGEMYLETILVLSRRLNKVRSVDVAEEMGYSKPSVSRAVGNIEEKRLYHHGWVPDIFISRMKGVRSPEKTRRHRVL